MATVLKRQGGQLVETDANTQELAQLQGVPLAPTTPVGVANLGGNEDQAKMAGTPAQKNTVLQQATTVATDQPKPEPTLQQAERQSAPRQEANNAESQAATKAAQLQSLGSLNTRVEALIANELKLQQQATLQVDDTVINSATSGMSQGQKDQAKQLVERMLAAPNDAQVLADAAQFWKENNLGDLDSFSPTAFQKTVDQALGSQAATQVRDDVRLQDLTLEDNELALLQEVFGDSWQQYSVPELAQKIEDLRQQEFARIESLRTEYAAATGTQREMLRRELADLSQVGMTGTEASVQSLQKQVSNADTVAIGGETYKVEELLKDEQISDLVARMVRDEKLLAKVAETNPEFAQWVTDNKESLGQLANELVGTKQVVVDVQKQKQNLRMLPNGSALSDRIMKAIVPDWDKITATVPTIESGLYSALTDPSIDNKTRQAMTTALEAAAMDPDMLAKLTKMSPDEFKRAYSLAAAIDNDETGGLLAKISGIGANSLFITDPEQQLQIARAKQFTDAFAAARANARPGFEAVIQDQDLLARYIRDGRLTTEHISLLANNPDRWTQYKNYNDKYLKLTDAKARGDVDAIFDVMFGRDVDLNVINQQYETAKRIAKIDPSSDAAKMLKQYEQWDTNKDGKFDDKDVAQLGDLILGRLSPDGSTGSPTDLDAFLKAGKVETNFADLERSTLDKQSISESNQGAFFDLMSKYLSDDKITQEELVELDTMMPGSVDKVLENLGHYNQYLDRSLQLNHKFIKQWVDSAKFQQAEQKQNDKQYADLQRVGSSIWGSTITPSSLGSSYYNSLKNQGNAMSAEDLTKFQRMKTALEELWASGTVSPDIVKNELYWINAAIDQHNYNVANKDRLAAERVIFNIQQTHFNNPDAFKDLRI